MYRGSYRLFDDTVTGERIFDNGRAKRRFARAPVRGPRVLKRGSSVAQEYYRRAVVASGSRYTRT